MIVIKKVLLKFATIWLVIRTIYYRLLNKKIYFLLGTPAHGNLGDQAIAIAERKFIKEAMQGAIIIEVMWLGEQHFISVLEALKKYIHKEDIICGYGGGNIGNWYKGEENARRIFIKMFPENKIIIFPQSIYFADTEQGKQELELSRHIYNNHKKIILLVRERISYNLSNKIFTDIQKVLVPDIVTYLQPSIQCKREGLLLCLRNDREKNNKTLLTKEYIVESGRKYFDKIDFTDTAINKKIFMNMQRIFQVKKKWKEIAGAGLVITDRLHGMIFSAITNTPCIAIPNISKKVEGEYEWLKNYPYILFAKNQEELEEKIIKLLNNNTQVSYDRENLREYWNTVAGLLK